ncbi:MAG: Lrp/AsnC ligand binding domain-containing protein [Aigarchaeota archaeon]|nr:Lrp/AsnC ligand binding domain-containing protein [Candidatus Pelearchaeum maunauluense]
MNQVGALELDQIDYRILAILQEDGRISLSNLARKARVSVPTARQRINRLVKEGVIQRFTILLDPKRITGYDIFIGISAKPADLAAIAEKLKNTEEVLGVYRTVGEHDLLVRLSVQSYAELDDFIAKKLSTLNGIQGIRTNIVVGVLKDEPGPRLKPGAGIRVFCVVCGKEIEGRPIKRTIEEREYYLCCNSCAALFDQKAALGYAP